MPQVGNVVVVVGGGGAWVVVVVLGGAWVVVVVGGASVVVVEDGLVVVVVAAWQPACRTRCLHAGLSLSCCINWFATCAAHDTYAPLVSAGQHVAFAMAIASRTCSPLQLDVEATSSA